MKVSKASTFPEFFFEIRAHASYFPPVLSGIFPFGKGGNSLPGNFPTKNEALPLWTKLTKAVINDSL
jgi:hypothetical protein